MEKNPKQQNSPKVYFLPLSMYSNTTQLISYIRLTNIYYTYHFTHSRNKTQKNKKYLLSHHVFFLLSADGANAYKLCSGATSCYGLNCDAFKKQRLKP